jgi:Fur family ferric uptake transcriptional regulator
MLLEKVQMVHKTDLEDGRIRYELSEQNKQAHHHLICVKCGVVFDMEDDLLEELEQQIREKKNFLVKDHSVKLYGYCENCWKATLS